MIGCAEADASVSLTTDDAVLGLEPHGGLALRFHRLARVELIDRAQRLGFSLDEVALLLGLSDGKHCAETKALAEKKLTVVEEKMNDLAAIQKALKGLVTKCSMGSRGSGCPVIDALIEDDL